MPESPMSARDYQLALRALNKLDIEKPHDSVIGDRSNSTSTATHDCASPDDSFMEPFSPEIPFPEPSYPETPSTIDDMDRVAKLEAENFTLKIENANLKVENANLKTENANLKAGNAKLEAQIDVEKFTSKTEKDNLKAQVYDLNAMVQVRDVEIGAFRDVMNAMKKPRKTKNKPKSGGQDDWQLRECRYPGVDLEFYRPGNPRADIENAPKRAISPHEWDGKPSPK